MSDFIDRQIALYKIKYGAVIDQCGLDTANEHYQQEQWDLQSTTNKSESAVIKQQTNADRIRSMTDEELAQEIWSYHVFASFADLLDWLKQEVDDGN